MWRCRPSTGRPRTTGASSPTRSARVRLEGLRHDLPPVRETVQRQVIGERVLAVAVKLEPDDGGVARHVHVGELVADLGTRARPLPVALFQARDPFLEGHGGQLAVAQRQHPEVRVEALAHQRRVALGVHPVHVRALHDGLDGRPVRVGGERAAGPRHDHESPRRDACPSNHAQPPEYGARPPRDDRTSYAGSMIRSLLCSALAMASATDGTASSASEPSELVLDERVLLRHGGLTAWSGGFGSAMAPHPSRPGFFYFLSDRGPNAGTGREDEKVFLRSSHAPRIGLFRREGTRLRLVREILLRDAAGRPLTGL